MPDYGARYEIERLRLLRRVIPAGRGAAAVDVGCNDGTISRLIADLGYSVTGVDLDAELIQRAQAAYPDLTFLAGSVAETGHIPRQLTVALELIEHIPPAAQLPFMQELAASCPLGSTLVLSTPSRHSLMSYYERWQRRGSEEPYDYWDPTHVGILTWRQLRSLLRAAGFRPRRVYGFYYLPQERTRPRATRLWPLSRFGFDLIVVAERARPARLGGRDSE